VAERRRRGSSVAQTIGGVLVGFDEQVWSRHPPAQEQVGQVDRARTVVVPGGLTVELPAEAPRAAPTWHGADSGAGARHDVAGPGDARRR